MIGGHVDQSETKADAAIGWLRADVGTARR